MKKIIIFIVLIVLIISIFCGCQSIVNKPGDIQIDIDYYREYPITNSEYQKFLVDNFDMSYEELEGYNVSKFVNEFNIYKMKDEWTSQEVKDVFEEIKDSYIGTDYAPFFIFEDEELEGSLPEDYKSVSIDVIAVRLWTGNNPPDMTVYVNHSSTEKEDMTLYKKIGTTNEVKVIKVDSDLYNKVKSIINDAKVYNWNTENIQKSSSTGSVSWDLIFVLRDGTIAKYTGFSNESFYPEKYRNTIESLLNLDE